MKTLLGNGSPRQQGNTSIALAEIAKTLEAESVATEIFWIGDEGMQTIRTLARNLAWLFRNVAADAVPRPDGEPWQPTHFIR